jgi:hypothetical protein
MTMEVKAFELRDRATFVPAVAVRLEPKNEAEYYLLRRAGYPCGPGDEPMILLAHMEGGWACYDPYAWGTSTVITALPYIRANWDKLVSGQVICTEFIRGERAEPKLSERVEHPNAAW